MELDPKDIKLDVFYTEPRTWVGSSMGVGVRATHIPTGASATCDTHRSQHKNREIALQDLKIMLEALGHEKSPVKLVQYEAFAEAARQVEAGMEELRKMFQSFKQLVEEPHPDDVAVDKFAAMMKAKLAKAREKGRGGWDNPERCSVDKLADMLVEHLYKGDPTDIANFAMMLALREAPAQTLVKAINGELNKGYWKGHYDGKHDD